MVVEEVDLLNAFITKCFCLLADDKKPTAMRI